MGSFRKRFNTVEFLLSRKIGAKPMIVKINSVLEEARINLTSDAEKHLVALALIRIIMQHACILLVEAILRIRKENPDVTFQRIPLPLEALRAPSDGTLASTLSELLVVAENDGWNGVSRPFFQVEDDIRPCSRYSVSKDINVESVLRGLVAIRNDGVEGHGLPGDYDPIADFDAVQFIASRLNHLLPRISENDELFYRSYDNKDIKLELLRTSRGNLICYRRISKSQDGKCIVRAQVQDGVLSKDVISYEATDVLGTPETGALPQYSYRSTYDEEWVPFVLIPDKLTNSFTGRDDELKEISEWFDDLDSRACLLYGDGGIGKTTLAIEFIHRLLSGEIKSKWKPQLITFFTAKQTRWSLKGLDVIRANPINVGDVAIFIAKAFDSAPLDRSWYACSPEDAIGKLTNYLHEWGIGRDDHLLILDNTETLITSDEEVKLLSNYVRDLSRRIGRILLTSRRRETVEARQIEISPLDPEESVALLRRRAEILNRQPILQAGIPKLRQYAERLGNKPLVLEVFVQALGERGTSLESAFDRVLRMQRQDLGEFLFTDAWNRMSLPIKFLILLMTRLGDFHDELLLKLCCMEAKVAILEASDALEESRGIASISRVDNHLQIVFSHDFMEYSRERTVNINNIAQPTDDVVERVRRRHGEFLRSASTRVYDRVDKAYRHPLARAAYHAFQQDRFDDSELFYEEASLKDSDNGWLFDRYAYFLFSQKRYEDALEKAKQATKLLPDDPEAWFTRGIIESRMGKLNDSLVSLNNSQQQGKPKHLCLLQMAYAYVNIDPPDKKTARRLLNEAERATPPERTGYNLKHLDEIARLQLRLENQI